MPDLMIIGTAHVIDLESPLEVFIREFEPEAIALELDRERWLALNSEKKRSRGPIFVRALARLQEYLGDTFGSSPGSEMLAAAKIARTIGADVKLIDKPIIPTLKGAWKNMPWNEFWNLIMDSLISFVGGGDLNFDQSMRTGDFSKELKEFSERYPSIKAQLIDRRDAHMSINLIKLFKTRKYNKIVAIVGEGHLEGINRRLSSLNPRVVKLSDLLQRKSNSVSFSIEI
jgi:pheromone shutdown protein TraB